MIDVTAGGAMVWFSPVGIGFEKVAITRSSLIAA